MLAILNFMYNGEVNVNQGGNLYYRESSQIICYQSTELRHDFGKFIFILHFFSVKCPPLKIG